MSYVPAFAPDANAQWRDLPFELQELVLDDLERLAENPPQTTVIFHDVFLEIGQIRHYVFLRSIVDHPRRMVTVIGVKHMQK
jgi:uncharacterized iron-regulated protein